jgi:DNA primase
VAPGLDPAGFTMEMVLDRVARDGDLFVGALAGKQSLKSALKALR